MRLIIVGVFIVLYSYSLCLLCDEFFTDGLSKTGKHLFLLSLWIFMIELILVHWIYQQVSNMQEAIVSSKYTRSLVRLLESRLSISERSSDQVLRILTEKTTKMGMSEIR